eukprot:scaffold29997_cov171-Skeletonema_menzelii.AAC.6
MVCNPCLSLLLLSFVSYYGAAFTSIKTCRCHRRFSTSHFSSINGANEVVFSKRSTTTFETTFASNRCTQESDKNVLSLTRLRKFLSRNSTQKPTSYRIAYDYDELVIGNTSSENTTTAVMLVHPIGVGIGKWYYDRLLNSLADANNNNVQQGGRMVFISPDLLGSYTASSPIRSDSGQELKKFPLLNITDWAEQLGHLMSEYEQKSCEEGYEIRNWAIVANGGCAPIALKVAQSAVEKSAPFEKDLTNIVISSPPRLPFFLESTDPNRVQRSYRTLSGVVGKLFWIYALRKEGKFIETFSKRNLVGDPASLGNHWTPNCVSAARHLGGKSKYSTFAFLSGALQDGCRDSLNSLKGTGVKIDFIRGTDRKQTRRPKSYFWKRKSSSVKPAGVETEVKQETVEEYIERNGNRGSTSLIGGRISLAWEDSKGYATELIKLLPY